MYNKRENQVKLTSTLNYLQTFGKHDVAVLVGYEQEHFQYRDFSSTKLGLQDVSVGDLNAVVTPYASGGYGTEYASRSYFGRVNYAYAGKYLFEANFRYDGSSRFAPEYRWGFFPSFSAGWRISEEPWLKETGKVDNLKIRLSWGQLGNIGNYDWQSTYGTANYVFGTDDLTNGIAITSIKNYALTWETTTVANVGIDFGFLKNRLTGTIDVYNKLTDGILYTPSMFMVMGNAGAPRQNIAEVTNRGIEFELGWRDNVGKDFTYSIKGSLWDSRTWVTKYYNQSGGMFNYYEGKELGEIWGFRTAGLFQSNEEAAAWPKDSFHNFVPVSGPYAGDVKFVDVNNDNEINTGSWTLDDHGDLERIGNEAPRYQFGLNLDFRWNGIGLSAFFQGVGKRDWYPSQGTDFFWGSYGRAYAYALKTQRSSHAILDKTTENWTLANASEDPYWPRQTYGTADSATGALTFPNDKYLQNAAYVRLKTLTLDYSLPKKVVEKAHLQQVRFYLTGENLWTWSPMFKHTRMFDPEVIGNGDSDFHSGTSTSMGDGYSYPLLRTFTFGVNITL